MFASSPKGHMKTDKWCRERSNPEHYEAVIGAKNTGQNTQVAEQTFRCACYGRGCT